MTPEIRYAKTILYVEACPYCMDFITINSLFILLIKTIQKLEARNLSDSTVDAMDIGGYSIMYPFTDPLAR